MTLTVEELKFKKNKASELIAERSHLDTDSFLRKAEPLTEEKSLLFDKIEPGEFQSIKEQEDYYKKLEAASTLAYVLLLTLANKPIPTSAAPQTKVKPQEGESTDLAVYENAEGGKPQVAGGETGPGSQAGAEGAAQTDIPDYYAILGVSRDASQEEIKDAYKKFVKENNYDQAAGRIRAENPGISTEEVDKRLEPLVRKMQDGNMANTVLTNEKNRSDYDSNVYDKYYKGKDMSSGSASGSSPSSSGFTVVGTPTVPKSKESRLAADKIDTYHTYAMAGLATPSSADISDLQSRNLLPPGTTPNDFHTANMLRAKGHKAKSIENLAENVAGLPQGSRESFRRSAYIMSALDEARVPGIPRSETLQLANRNPESSITFSTPSGSSGNNVSFTFGSSGEANPLVQMAGDKIKDFFTDKGKKLALDKFKNTALSKAIQKGGQQLAKKGAAILAKVGIKRGAQAIAASTGIGAIVAVGIELLDKAWSKIKIGLQKLKTLIDKNKDVIAGLGLALMGAGAMLGSGLLTIAGGGALATVAFSGTSLTGAIGGGIGWIANTAFLLFIAGPASIGIGVLIGIFGFILLVILIVFIINTGGYVVPYWVNPGTTEVTLFDAYGNPIGTGGSTGISVDNPYIGVGKSPDFTQTTDPRQITYTITILAKQGNLSNIQITDYTCEAIKENDVTIGCPPANPTLPDPGVVIAVGETYQFTYSVYYDIGAYANSLVTDTITITADSSAQAGVTSSASASVCFGDCPEDCPSGWPVFPQNGQTQLQVTQGPFTGPDYNLKASHRVLDALDITSMDGPNYQAFNGTLVKATHSGLFCVGPANHGRRGDNVYVIGSCKGITFASVYGHLMKDTNMIASGTRVNKGQGLALGDDTGGWNFPHLHYEFASVVGSGESCQGYSGSPGEPSMQSVYGIGRCWWNCGVTIP